MAAVDPKPTEHACLNCGYCPHCGRSNLAPLPYYPRERPYWTEMPYWPQRPIHWECGPPSPLEVNC
jgi:hypothetical protein